MDINTASSMASNVINRSSVSSKENNVANSNNLLKGVNLRTEEGKKEVMKNASNVDAKALMAEYALQFQTGMMENARDSFGIQGGLSKAGTDELRKFLNSIDTKTIGYNGKPLGSLTSQEAADLISEDGFFGVKKTSDRLADFVIMGAGNDIDKLLAGRKGILQGYDSAERLWGDKLPDISKETLDKALEKIDKKIEELKGSSSSSSGGAVALPLDMKA
ncbi:hypothetical protein CCZ01_01865 [Helicobacter monodelphidis]|uniref:hydrogenase-4 component G n=1 Tax=Helicobacter sp. 15-1451 TaxID=2004995 RepID=UPI000DCE6215|nr:hydrogenase-4 component G [Helicobacter sp. 15-1451]RAX58962.1 hypothetical protein CCZ01_01865 [Helicobacter sp. 15-1451]